MSTSDGGPAFPCEQRHTEHRDGRWMDRWIPEGGMSLRDYFAGQAMNGMLASDSSVDRTAVVKSTWAQVAYEFADAMLKVRQA